MKRVELRVNLVSQFSDAKAVLNFLRSTIYRLLSEVCAIMLILPGTNSAADSALLPAEVS